MEKSIYELEQAANDSAATEQERTEAFAEMMKRINTGTNDEADEY